MWSLMRNRHIHYGVSLIVYLSHGRKKIVARPGLEPRAIRLPCEHSATELASHLVVLLHITLEKNANNNNFATE